MDLSKLRQRLMRLSEERSLLERIIMNRDRLIKGSLVWNWNVCGKKNCCCKKGKKHGPFPNLSVSIEGRTRMVFVPKDELVRVEKLAGNYKRFRKARARIVEINQEILSVINQIEQLKLEQVKRDGKKK